MLRILRIWLWAVALASLSLAPTASAEVGELAYGAGKRVATVVHEPYLLGTLPAAGKEPFLVFSGLGCADCDINRSIYIWSPSDPPMVSGETGDRYSHPGAYYDESGKLVETVRTFIGRCTTSNENVVIWFSISRAKDSQVKKSTFVVKVIDHSLNAGFSADRTITISAALAAAGRHMCREVLGRRFDTD